MGLISNGTTIFDNGSMGSGIGSSLSFISKQTASSSASISFTSGIDSTYKEYVFYFKDIHPSVNGADFTFQASVNNGSTYGVTTTGTYFWTQHNEGDTYAELEYRTDNDIAQSTSFIKLTDDVGNQNDVCAVGYLNIFNPSSTTFVKHYMANIQHNNFSNASRQVFTAGYFNDGSNDIDAIQFKFSSGNIDSGDILLYGVN